MKRFHVHVRVKDLLESVNFYTALFNTEAHIVKPDYAKWMLEDPRINFAISTGHKETGIEHLGLQTDSEDELLQVYGHMKEAKGKIREEGECTCCYSKSQKSWVTDPQGVDWEAFFTHGNSTVYGEGINVRPAPETMDLWTEIDSKKVEKKEIIPAVLEHKTCTNESCSH